jgi:CRISPR-associated protein Csb3
MIAVNLNPHNPGQVLACCGLFELSELLSEGGKGWFSYEGEWKFFVETPVSLTDVMAFLENSKIKPIDESDSRIAMLREKEREEVLDKLDCPVLLQTPKSEIVLYWWWNPTFTDKSKWATGTFKGWAGHVSHVDILKEFMGKIPDIGSLQEPENIFKETILCRTFFGFDSRGAWTARDIGFSADEVYGKRGKVRISPIVEVLAFIGLQTFKPKKEGNNSIKYYLWRWHLPILPARFALPGIVKADLVGPFHAEAESRGVRGAYKCFKEAKLSEG